MTLHDQTDASDALAESEAAAVEANFRLQLLHASDLEGGVDAIDRAANFAAIVNALRADAEDAGWASILLSAGDNYLPGPFAGAAGDASLRAVLDQVYETLFPIADFDIRESIARVDVTIMNILGFDASAIGNHEFDFGANEFITLVNDDVRSGGLTRWLGAQFPYLSSNLDFSAAPGVLSAGLVAAGVLPSTAFAPAPEGFTDAAAWLGAQQAAPKIADAVTIARDGELIGVVGATTQRVTTISSTGAVTETTSNGTDDMAALAAALQPVIDDLIDGADNASGTADDVTKVILVSHLQDINLEKQLAGLLRGVDIIVAGGSDTRLADGTDALRPGDTAAGDYPFQTTDANGDPLLIVSTDGEYSYVGRLVVEFDANGKLVNFDGGARIVDETISGAFKTDDEGVTAVTGAATAEAAVDADADATLVETLVEAVASVVTAQDANIFGRTDSFIEGRRELVRTEETSLGNISADANLAYAKSVDPTVVISIKNGGGIRAAIGEVDGLTGDLLPTSANPDSGKEAGEISQLDIVNALRFNNALSLVSLTTAELAQVLEHAVAAVAPGATPGQFPQVSGVRFSFDATRPVGDRILSAAVVDENGDVIAKIVRGGEVVDNGAQTFRIVTLNFLAGGGDGYPFPSFAATSNRVDLLQAGVRTGDATFADDGSEQDAFAEYLQDNFSTTPFTVNETGPEGDTRIQNLAARADEVLVEFTINETDADTPGADAAEFVELYDGGFGGQSLDGLVVVFFNGSSDTSYAAFDLDGFTTDADGFFVLGNAGVASVDVEFNGNLLQNGADAVALYRGDAADFANGTAPTMEGLLDAIVYDTADEDDAGLLAALGQTVQVDENGGAGSTSDALARLPDGTGGFVAQAPTPGATNVPPPPPPEVTLISAIQGRTDFAGGDALAVIGVDDVSPLRGQVVTVEAIVTADFQGGTGLLGFFVQEEDADADGDEGTSEGLFVFDGATPLVDVAVGDRVRVTGVVGEFEGQTQISAAGGAVEVLSRGNAAPAATVVSLLEAGALSDGQGGFSTDLERFEGMRVTLAETVTVSELFQLDRFGTSRVTAGDRPQSFTQTNLPDAEGFAAHLQDVAARTVLIDDGSNVQNPSPIRVPDGNDGVLTAGDTYRMGDRLSGVTGVLAFSEDQQDGTEEGEFRIHLPEAEYEAANPRPEAPPEVGGRIQAAGFNVLNFFTTLDTFPGNEGVGPDGFIQEPRGADTNPQQARPGTGPLDEFERQLDKLVEAIVTLGAEVYGLTELENDFLAGGDAPDVAAAQGDRGPAVAFLAEAINDRLGGDFFGWVDPGTEFVGTDAISVGFIYDTRAVRTAGDVAILDDAAFTDPLGTGGQQNRPAMAQTFEEVGTGGRFTAVVNHLKSKGSGTGAPEDADQLDGQGASNATRTAAAEALAAWLGTDPTGQGDADFLLLGDYNAYAREDPIRALEAAGFADLAARFGEAGDYSYVFDGQTGTLDYALANPALLGQVTGAAAWGVSADEADAFDYNLEFGRDPALFDGTTPFRPSDHDPVVVGLDLQIERDGTSGDDRIAGGAFGDVIASGAGRNDIVAGGGGADRFVFGAETRNGVRETDQIRDYDAAEGDVIDLGPASVASFRETGSAVRLTLDGDGDVIVVSGVTRFDQILFADDLIA